MQDQLFSKFIFADFLYDFSHFFKIYKDNLLDDHIGGDTTLQRDFYSWNDKHYRDFIIATLATLEPVFYRSGTKIHKELDEFGEITFIYQGDVKVGFKINEMEKYAIRYRSKCIIAAFGVTFDNRSQYIYKATTSCQGFFIRKENWKKLLKEQDCVVVKLLKRSIMVDYMWNFRSKILVQKKKVLEHFKLRSDF